MGNSIAGTIEVIAGVVLNTATLSLIWALILQIAANLLAGFKPEFPMAYKASFVSLLLPAITGLILNMLFKMEFVSRSGEIWIAGILGVMIGLIFFLLIQAFIYVKTIKPPGGGGIGYGHACLIGLIQLVATLSVPFTMMFVWMTFLACV